MFLFRKTNEQSCLSFTRSPFFLLDYPESSSRRIIELLEALVRLSPKNRTNFTLIIGLRTRSTYFRHGAQVVRAGKKVPEQTGKPKWARNSDGTSDLLLHLVPSIKIYLGEAVVIRLDYNLQSLHPMYDAGRTASRPPKFGPPTLSQFGPRLFSSKKRKVQKMKRAC